MLLWAWGAQAFRCPPPRAGRHAGTPRLVSSSAPSRADVRARSGAWACSVFETCCAATPRAREKPTRGRKRPTRVIAAHAPRVTRGGPRGKAREPLAECGASHRGHSTRATASAREVVPGSTRTVADSLRLVADVAGVRSVRPTASCFRSRDARHRDDRNSAQSSSLTADSGENQLCAESKSLRKPRCAKGAESRSGEVRAASIDQRDGGADGSSSEAPHPDPLPAARGEGAEDATRPSFASE